MKQKIIILTGCYLPGFMGGGPIRSIANMVEQLGDFYDFSIITSDRDLGATSPYQFIIPKQWNVLNNTSVFYVFRGFDGLKDIARLLRVERFNTVSLNSFFSFKFSVFPLIFCKIIKKKCNIIIGPRGEFSSGALGIKSLKKRIYINSVKIFGLYNDVIWHASSNYEASDIRRVMGEGANIRVAVNISRPGDDFPLSPRIVNSPLRVIFISRISPMKNLAGAIDILRRVNKDIVFDVYGPAEEKSYWAECQVAAGLLPKNIKFNYWGPLLPVKVISTLSRYDLFFLPTLGENFGHVIAEALSAGVPVLISDRTPWRNLDKKSIGWDIPLDQPDRFVEVLEDCCNRKPREYNVWRKNIRNWAVENIGNNDAVEQNRQLFMNLN